MSAANTIVIKTKDDKSVEIDRALLVKFSNLAKTALEGDKEAKEIPLNISEAHFRYVKEYMEHHSKKETPPPVAPIQKSWTLDNAFEDKWDGTFLKRVKEDEKDPTLVGLCYAIEYLDMETMLKKVTLAVTLHIIETYGLESDKIAEGFAQLAAKNAK